MKTLKSLSVYVPLLPLCVSYVAYILLPNSLGNAAASGCALLAICLVSFFYISQMTVPHPRSWKISSWLVLCFICMTLVSTAFSHSVIHALWGFSFDMTSTLFLLGACVYAYVLADISAVVRKVVFVAGVSVLLLIFMGSALGGPVHVRPSPEVTLLVESRVHDAIGLQTLFVGFGPNSFVYAWQRFHPAEVAQTPFWNEDFSTGSGMLPTVAVEVGLVGALFLLLAFLFAGAQAFAGVLTRNAPPIKRALSVLYAGGIFFALYMLITTEPSAPLLLASFVVMASAGYGEGVKFFLSTGVQRILQIVIALAALSAAYILVSVTLYFYSFSQVAGDLIQARSAGELSYRMTGDPQTARLLSQILRSTAHSIGVYNLPKSDTLPLFQTAAGYARKATVREPQNAENWELLGINLAEQLSLQKNASFATEGKSAFDTAAKLAPSDPSIPFFEAQLYILAGNTDGAKKLLDAALVLRPSYTEASDLRASIK